MKSLSSWNFTHSFVVFVFHFTIFFFWNYDTIPVQPIFSFFAKLCGLQWQWGYSSSKNELGPVNS
jgi:hypothetical protein